MRRRISFAILLLAVLGLTVTVTTAVHQSPAMKPAHPAALSDGDLTPVVFFPGMFLSMMQVIVTNQTAFPECPASGTFLVQAPGPEFSEVCRGQMLTLVYDPDPGKPMSQRFSSPRGIKVVLPDYGKTENAPTYEVLYESLEAAGYHRNTSIRVASYDFRLTPDIGSFLDRTVELIEETYRDNGHRPVHLVGHSNGPIYAQYLLTHTSAAWKRKYIHGFTPLAGNFAGQGSAYGTLFTGLGVPSYPTDADMAHVSANMCASWPATYITASSPAVLDNKEVVVQVSGGSLYTPKDYQQLLRDAGLTRVLDIANFYVGFDKFATPDSFPNVDVYAEKGSGYDTVVGIVLPSLQVGQLVTAQTGWITLPGDANQEDLTNDSVRVWQDMPCYHFELNDNPGVSHMDLPFAQGVIARLLTHLAARPSQCR